MIARHRASVKRLLAATALLAGGFSVGLLCMPRPMPEPHVQPAATSPVSELISEVRLGDTTVGAAFDYVRELTHVNLAVDWRSLAESRITPDTPVRLDLRLHDVSLAQVLAKLLSAIPVSNGQLNYSRDRGVVAIFHGGINSTSADGPDVPVTQVYDVRDLLGERGPWERLAMRPGDNDPTTQPSTIPDRGERLTQLLARLVAPQSWRDNGGALGAAQMTMGKLIVTQSPENHECIAEVLRVLRAAQADPKSIEGQ